MDVEELRAEADRLLTAHQALLAGVRPRAEAHTAALTAGLDRLAEAAAAVEQAGRAWAAARLARDLAPGTQALVLAADQAEEAYFAADAHSRDVHAETAEIQRTALAELTSDGERVAAAGAAFRAAQDAYFDALARTPVR